MAKEDYKILVVDDSKFIRDLVKNSLIEREFKEIFLANSGNDAFEIFKSAQPDLILLDINMLDGDGINTLKEIMNLNPKAKCIMVSALDQEEIKKEAKKIGAVDYIEKPFEMSRLMSAVEKVYNGGY